MRIGFIHIGDEKHGVFQYGKFLANNLSVTTQIEISELHLLNQSHCLKDCFTWRKQLLSFQKQCDALHLQHTLWFLDQYGRGFGGMLRFVFLISILRLPIICTFHDFKNTSRRHFDKPLYRQLISCIYHFIHYSTQYTSRKEGFYALSYEFIKVCMGKWLLRRCKLITVNTHHEKNQFPPHPFIKVIPHYIPKTQLPLISHKEAKSALGLSSQKVLLYFGFIQPSKGYRILLRTLALLPECKLIFAGGDPIHGKRNEINNVTKIAKRLNVLSRIQITGFLSEEKRLLYLRAADLALAPLLPRVMASGSMCTLIAHECPILTSKTPFTLELTAQQKEAIYFFDARDPVHLSSKIRELLSLPYSIRQKNVVVLKKHFSFERLLPSWICAYDSLISCREAPLTEDLTPTTL